MHKLNDLTEISSRIPVFIYKHFFPYSLNRHPNFYLAPTVTTHVPTYIRISCGNRNIMKQFKIALQVFLYICVPNYVVEIEE